MLKLYRLRENVYARKLNPRENNHDGDEMFYEAGTDE